MADKSPADAVPPVAVAAAESLLAGPADVNAAMGATDMAVDRSRKSMWHDSKAVEPACLAVDGPAQSAIYAGSGWSAVRAQVLRKPGEDYDRLAYQAVVLFPTGADASGFYAASVRRWPQCVNRRYTFKTEGEKPDRVWTVGPLSERDGMLSTSSIQEGGDGWSCHRALTTRNNVAIDIVTCSYNQTDTSAVALAELIAAKVPSQ